MKKMFLILAGITISLVSCKKDDKGGEEPAPKTDIQVKALLEGNNTLENVTLGQSLMFEVKITDTQNNEGKKVTYHIFPTKSDKNNYHHVASKDFDLLIYSDDIKDLKGINIDTATGEITYPKPGTYKIIIKPLVAGSFEIHLNTYKEIEGENKPYFIENTNLNFNVVDIKVRTEVKRDGSKYKNVLYFQINDGDGANDTFLTAGSGVKQEYLVQYLGKTLTGDFDQGKEFLFYESDYQTGSAPEISTREISRIHIERVSSTNNSGRKRIDYYNVKF